MAFLFLIDHARLWVKAYLPLDRRNRYIIPVKKATPYMRMVALGTSSFKRNRVTEKNSVKRATSRSAFDVA